MVFALGLRKTTTDLLKVNETAKFQSKLQLHASSSSSSNAVELSLKEKALS